jgi:propionyl-CoA carboxylase alpha chain
MQNERWRTGHLSTAFIAQEFPDGFKPLQPQGETALRMAAVAAALDHRLNARKRHISGQLRDRMRFAFEQDRTVLLAGERLEVTVEEAGPAVLIHFKDGSPDCHLLSNWVPGVPVWTGAVNGIDTAVQVRHVLNGFLLDHAGVSCEARVYTRREAELAALMLAKTVGDTSKVLLCPMPGLVRAISVAVGQAVKRGESLCMVEAMKMENVLRAERDVTIAKILAKEGDSLAVDAVIMEFA